MNIETMETKKIQMPKEILSVMQKLHEAGFHAYAVGGCVRDLLLGRIPQDWDITTDAKPEEIQKVFPDSFYANQFLTVTVKTGSDDETLKEVEITTFRAEGRYTDKRHPDELRFAETLEEDLSRRDFTINAVAVETTDNRQPTTNNHKIIDPYNGQEDLENKLVRAVGEPEKRFEEDALRMLRAVRFAAKLGFNIEEKTLEAIKNNAGWLQAISKERIRDEFIKVIGSRNAKNGIELLRETGLLKHIVTELLEGYGVGQNKHHIYTVWEHNLRALEYGADQNYPVDTRIAALFHDIGKPRTKRGDGPDSTFYGHDVVGGKMSFEILTRLRFPAKTAEKIAKLVRWHLFNYKLRRDVEEEIRKELGENLVSGTSEVFPQDPEEIELKGQNYTTDASIRRLIRNVDPENMDDLVKVRICDRIGSGVPKAVPYRLRHFQYRVEKILREGEAVKVTMLKINGDDLKKLLGLAQGPKIGHILNALFEETLDDSAKNNREYLKIRAKELNGLSEEELFGLRKKAQDKAGFIEEERDAKIKKKYWVK